jgi:hypothetical protein
MPTTYTGATYKILPDTAVNSTHWTLSGICTGCSKWAGTSGGSTKWLNPQAGAIRVAWAQNPKQGSVSQPSNPNSKFEYHEYFGTFDADFAGSVNNAATWTAAVAKAKRA